jgi:DNA invertase Pin-like site-specific DNA recombinase
MYGGIVRGNFVAYYRVSTARQGRSGLGLDAQRKAVADHLNGGRWTLLREFTEIESGKVNVRPELAKALHLCRVTGATLVIAKLDRLSRNAAFLLTLRDSGVKFVAADCPDANNLTVGILALIAEHEREAISRRTREALAAAKRRGVRLGNPHGAAPLRRAGKGNRAALAAIQERADTHALELQPVLEDLRGERITTLAGIAAALNDRSMRTPRGGQWHASSVRNLLARIGEKGLPKEWFSRTVRARFDR